jgi:hypothetical protein
MKIQLPITNYQLPITSYQLPVTSYQSPVTNYQSLEKLHCQLLFDSYSWTYFCFETKWQRGIPLRLELLTVLLYSAGVDIEQFFALTF